MSPGGAIVNISGVIAEQNLPGMAAYGASKAAVRAFDQALSKDRRRRCRAVCHLKPSPPPSATHSNTARATSPAPHSESVAVTDVVIVGAGLAGLACAQDLTRAGVECQVLEASDGVGGRVRTDAVEGFRLDLGYFEPGAMVRVRGAFHPASDPLRRPLQIPRTIAAPIGTLADKARVARLVIDVRAHFVRELLRRPDTTTADRLARAGSSNRSISAFWRPLFAGIQLDPQLEVSSRRFDTILRMLSIGSTGLPRRGIGAIPAQLASTLPENAVRLEARVARVDGSGVLLDDGEQIGARAVVSPRRVRRHTVCSATACPIQDRAPRLAAGSRFVNHRCGPMLILDGEASGPAMNLTVISGLSPSYAPAGTALVAAAMPGPDALDPMITARVREQLAHWFGSTTLDWAHLRTDVIAHGQPTQRPPLHPRQRVALGDGLFACGDHRDTASIQGAMFSGERTASAVLRRLRG
jgi:phytoene dehydrogenase-like protein